MKYLLAAIHLWGIALSSCLCAGTYFYNAAVPDWYTSSKDLPAWTIDTPPGSFFGVTKDKNQISFVNTNADWQMRIIGDYAGANWHAPQGEVITEVEYVFSGVYGVGGAPQFSVWGGTTSPDVQITLTDLQADLSQESQTASLQLHQEENYRQIRLCAWWCDPEKGGVYCVHPNWFSKIISVKIMTVPAP